MLESNAIEGETRLNPNDVCAAEWAIYWEFHYTRDILYVHGLLTEHLAVPSSGKWREINVQVGNWFAPAWNEVPDLMNSFMSRFGKMNSWQAHNEFEKIHPFQDWNGRVGRLLWLSKAVKEGYDFSVPFLQKFYYQTLQYGK